MTKNRYLRVLLSLVIASTIASASEGVARDGSPSNRSLDLTMLAENSVEPNFVSGALTFAQTPLDQDRNSDGSDLSSSAFGDFNTGFALTGASSLTSIVLDSQQSLVLSGAPGQTVTLSLQNLVLSDRSTLTLEGTATTSFVINVTKQFSLSGSSRIALSGGIQWDQVVFNVIGKARVKGAAIVWGTINANQRKVVLIGHSMVWGQVFAKRIVLKNAAQIITPPVVSQ